MANERWFPTRAGYHGGLGSCRPVGRGGVMHPPQTPEVYFFLLTKPSLLFYSLHFSGSSFFALKLHGNTCYAGYLQDPLISSFQLQEVDLGGNLILPN